MQTLRRIATSVLLVGAGWGVLASTGSADLSSRYQAGQQRSSQLRSRIHSESDSIQGFEGTIGSLQTRLAAVQSSVSIQARLLGSVTDQLRSARTRIAELQVAYAQDVRELAAQLLADYESPPPSIVDVLVDSGGFNDLLNRITDLSTIEHHNTQVATAVRATRVALEVQARRLATVKARRQRATASVLVERDNIAQYKEAIVNRELRAERARNLNTSHLVSLHRTLVREAHVLDQRAAAAETLSSGGAVAPPGGCVNTPFVAHGGEFGFFEAPGTNYTVNEEPVIAARLDQLGKALQLHLIGISGYRTPQHSVEVGGFADDPHTRGEASDTPGIEGVPESTLEEFCLTRPFPGAREADHIQEL
jgi:peptidoglycan hydrolase CwlO-like protein